LFSAAALQEAAPNGVILSDDTAYYPLVLVQMRDHLEPQVSIQYPLEFKELDCSVSVYQNKLKASNIYAVLPNTYFSQNVCRDILISNARKVLFSTELSGEVMSNNRM